MQPKPVSAENLISPSTAIKAAPQALTGSPSAEFAESDLLSQESYAVGSEPAKLAAAITPAVAEEAAKTSPAATTPIVIYGFTGMDSTSDTDDTEGDTGGGGTPAPQSVNEPKTETSVFITNLTPNSGIPGTDIVIQGAGFDSTPSNNAVKFGSVSADFVSYISKNQLRVTIPGSLSAGFTDLSVSVNGVSSNLFMFCVLKSTSGNVFMDKTQDVLPAGMALTDSSIVRLGDVDNDKDLDLFIVDASAGTAYLLTNDDQEILLTRHPRVCPLYLTPH
jgi:hypothetical protein